MKKIYFLLCIIIASGTFVNAQSFVRIYNFKGHKIAKGRLVDSSCTDSIAVIKKDPDNDTIAIQKISHIKTKHSVGNNILYAIIINAPLCASIGSAYSDFDKGNAALGGLVVGAIIGTIEGMATSVFKNSETYNIKGNTQSWHLARAMLTNR